MIIIKCSSCGVGVKRWGYEVKALQNVSTYICKACRVKRGRIEKICPVCGETFSGLRSRIHKNITCSHKCSNTYFRTGEGNGNWNPDTYRSTCFLYHKKECVVCKECNIVEVHHFDEDSNNNAVENLVPICPTHHKYWHSRYKHLIAEKVATYVASFKKKRGIA